jgi:uncharacterized membrane protein YeaQ/YmgE (transglycosylase-associated protein family)
MMNIVWFLIVGLVAGWLAGRVVRGRGFGLLGNLIIGVIGAFIGGYLFTLLGFATQGLIASIIVAFVGAIILILVLNMIKR